MSRRTQADRTAATRNALIAAAREQFAESGFAGVGLETVSLAAGVSRGAAYHHFGNKAELFAAVLLEVESDVTDRVVAAATAGTDSTLPAVMVRAVGAWLDACESADVQRILLLDGPSVLGWARWRELLQPYALTLVEGLLEGAMASNELPALPARPLAHVLVAMADEAALYVSSADRTPMARADMLQVVEALISGLTTGGHGSSRS